MARQFRFLIAGQPAAPWRSSRGEAEQDAIEQGLGRFSRRYGRVFITVPGEIASRQAPEENGPT